MLRAIQEGHETVVQTLLTHGVSANQTDVRVPIVRGRAAVCCTTLTGTLPPCVFAHEHLPLLAPPLCPPPHVCVTWAGPWVVCIGVCQWGRPSFHCDHLACSWCSGRVGGCTYRNVLPVASRPVLHFESGMCFADGFGTHSLKSHLCAYVSRWMAQHPCTWLACTAILTFWQR
jgi:hypothetical protein